MPPAHLTDCLPLGPLFRGRAETLLPQQLDAQQQQPTTRSEEEQQRRCRSAEGLVQLAVSANAVALLR